MSQYFSSSADFQAYLNALPPSKVGNYVPFDPAFYAAEYMGSYQGTLTPFVLAAVFGGLAVIATIQLAAVGKAAVASAKIIVEKSALNPDVKAATSLAPIVKKVTPSVVNISSTRTLRLQQMLPPARRDADYRDRQARALWLLGTMVNWERQPGRTWSTSSPPLPVAKIRSCLRECLRDPSWVVRMHAAEAAGSLGSDATLLLPELAALLNETNENVRVAAIR